MSLDKDINYLHNVGFCQIQGRYLFGNLSTFVRDGFWVLQSELSHKQREHKFIKIGDVSKELLSHIHKIHHNERSNSRNILLDLLEFINIIDDLKTKIKQPDLSSLILKDDKNFLKGIGFKHTINDIFILGKLSIFKVSKTDSLSYWVIGYKFRGVLKRFAEIKKEHNSHYILKSMLEDELHSLALKCISDFKYHLASLIGTISVIKYLTVLSQNIVRYESQGAICDI